MAHKKSTHSRREVALITPHDGAKSYSKLRRPHVRFFTPYNQDWLNRIRSAIPELMRAWNSNDRCWEIDPDYADAAEEITTDCFDDVDHMEEEIPPPPKPPDVVYSGYDWLREFIYDFVAPGDLKELHRKAAMRCHPDKGGSDERMRRLTEVWEKVLSEIHERTNATD